MRHPEWVAAWLAEGETRVRLTDEKAQQLRAETCRNRAFREAAIAFPPGCVVACSCGASHGDADVAIAAELLPRPEGVYVGCLLGPSGKQLRYRRADDLRAVAYCGFWTPALMTSVLSDDAPN